MLTYVVIFYFTFIVFLIAILQELVYSVMPLLLLQALIIKNIILRSIILNFVMRNKTKGQNKNNLL